MGALRRAVAVLVLVAAGLAVAPAGAAHAVSAAEGYVWASQPNAATYLAATGYEYNSTGGDIEITRSAVGRYRVRFEGMGTAGGVAHVTAHGSGTGFCTVVGWSSSGGDESVTVRCFASGGALADMAFLAHFTNRQPAAGTFAYLWSNQAAPVGSYVPSALYRYDSTGAAPTVDRVAVGQYFVYVGAVDDIYPDYETGRFQVTAYGTAAVHCEHGTINDEVPVPITVRCYNADGDPTDSRFSFSYAQDVNLLGTNGSGATAWISPTHDLPAHPAYTWLVTGWSSPGEEPTVTRLNTGLYLVTFPGFSGAHGYATAGADTNAEHPCHVVGWNAFGDDESVIVACVDGTTHLPLDVAFTVAYLA